MVGKQIREVRCTDVLCHFMANNRGLSFFTFTTPDVVGLYEIRQRWRSLRHYLAEREGEGFKYVMNYELHPRGHGWHIHSVFNRYINLRGGGLAQLRRYGFGMIRSEKVDSLGVSMYLSQHCLKAYRGVRDKLHFDDCKRLRLVSTSRGLPKLSDYKWSSAYLSAVRSRLAVVSDAKEFRSLSWLAKYRISEVSALTGDNVFKVWARMSETRSRLLCVDLEK